MAVWREKKRPREIECETKKQKKRQKPSPAREVLGGGGRGGVPGEKSRGNEGAAELAVKVLLLRKFGTGRTDKISTRLQILCSQATINSAVTALDPGTF